MDPVLLQVANAALKRLRRKEWVKQKRKWKQKRKRKQERKRKREKEEPDWRSKPRKKARCSCCGGPHRCDSPKCPGLTKAQLREAAEAANAAAENKRMRVFIIYFLDKYCPLPASPPSGSPV